MGIGHRPERPADLRDRSGAGAQTRKQQHAERDRQPIAGQSEAARRRIAGRPRQHRPERGPEDRLRDESSRGRGERRVPAAWRAREHRRHGCAQDAQPGARQYRRGAGARFRRRLVRWRGPARRSGLDRRRLLGELVERGRLEPDRADRSEDRRAPRTDRDGPDAAGRCPAPVEKGLRVLPGSFRLSHGTGADPRRPGLPFGHRSAGLRLLARSGGSRLRAGERWQDVPGLGQRRNGGRLDHGFRRGPRWKPRRRSRSADPRPDRTLRHPRQPERQVRRRHRSREQHHRRGRQHDLDHRDRPRARRVARRGSSSSSSRHGCRQRRGSALYRFLDA